MLAVMRRSGGFAGTAPLLTAPQQAELLTRRVHMMA
eukprot:CAMPEP_0195105864 /NCGR_PEP_ID=MMETSP0448-20130528/78280_1 /TAXON_ID=66468 /ORGANISM="Heterocapsa triquestra, Strain CCMP 448" /LENGTH=35 /DNA_ID= /DNA_START= /DNA_END= /DNA_ORIENTATION=